MLDFSSPCQKASASATGTGAFLTLPSATFPGFLIEYVSDWTIVIDCAAGAATGTPTVAVQTFNPVTGTFQSITKGGPSLTTSMAIVTAASDVIVVNINGPLLGLQLNVTVWGTPGGTVYGYVLGI